MTTSDAADVDNASAEKSGTLQVRDASQSAVAAPRIDVKPGIKSKARSWYQHYIAELLLRRKPPALNQDGRRIPLRLEPGKPLIDERRGHPYISNAIRTSRYTVYDFLPKQLFFQFSRLANFYFLCVGVPQTIPGLSTTGNYTTILPLLFFVLLTVAKEGYDDWKRHRLDKKENARTAVALRPSGSRVQVTPALGRWFRLGFAFKAAAEPDRVDVEEANETGSQWARIPWRDLRVGDVIKLARDEEVPADIVLLHANGENGLAYIETMALDGETNLKSKQVSTALDGCDSIEGIARCPAEFVVEDPNPDLYRFDGRVTVGDKTLPLTLNEAVYRGCTLRNTSRAIGIVVNTGEDCKIRRNANRHPSAKKPALEKVSNKIVITLAIYVVLLSVGCSMGYIIWRGSTERYAWYLTDASVAFQEIIIGFAIQFNNVIPLALYISLEIVKIGQMIFLNSDLEMYDEASDTPARCNTNTILENLGQIGYIFSDKTGTLTENVMKFRKMSIAGTAWLHETDIEEEALDAQATVTVEELNPEKGEGGEIVSSPRARTSFAGSFRANPMSPTSLASPGSGRRSSSHWRSAARPDHVQPELGTRDLLEYIRLRPDSPFSRRATQYILALAICHTCLPETKDGQLEYQAASPDELALVQAAKELGYVLVQRSNRSLTLEVADESGIGGRKVYEVLDVIEFSSKRKRMSVVVRCPDGRIWFVTKGADSTILPRLKMAGLAMQKATEVRKSADLERELIRKSEAKEPRNSFGGRPSLTLRRSIGRQPSYPGPSGQTGGSQAKSFETSRARKSEDLLRQSLTVKTTSLDVPRRTQPRSAGLGHSNNVMIPRKFAFLEDPHICDESKVFAQCFQHLDEFATEGLRTLLFAHKYIPEQEYYNWKKTFDEATTSLVDREERIDEAAELIEQSLDLMGASAIEDKLQDGVPETIDRLRRANIKIWMLTGDKRETAINIAHSARVCLPESETFILDVTKGGLEAQLLAVAEDLELLPTTSSSSTICGLGHAHSVIVIDGHTLAAIDEPGASRLQSLFYHSLIPNVDSVICCRASPSQKALLVRSIRKTSAQPPSPSPSSSSSALRPWMRFKSVTSTPLTLAIGDGANDLAMLAEAHVGIGVSGKEGMQAARVADYSIAQFRFLSRLLLVHGRWNYMRTARFILATFWKEVFFYLPTALYQRYNGYTGTSLYENWSLTVLNTLFTSLCVVVPGIWEQDLSSETLLAVPELYVYGQRNQGLNLTKYIGWMAGGAAEGVLVWFGCWAGHGALGLVRDEGLFALGDLAFSTGIMWTNLKLL